jgi:hypothetical protein
MNHNFLGQPTREETQTLDQLRRQLMPMIGLLDKLHLDMQQKMHRGEVVEWPQIRHTISAINYKLSSINGYINGYYKHAEEAVKDSNNKPVLDEENNPRMRYIDTAEPGKRDMIAALHVFPHAPYPMGNDQLAYTAEMLLEKRLGPNEQKWLEERIRKAAEFAYVPGELGIDVRKPVEVKEDSDDDDDDMKGWDDGIPTRRVKGTLSEDQITEMWSLGHKTAFDKAYAKDMRFGEDDDGEEDEDEEEEEMEDVPIEGLTPSNGGNVKPAEGDEGMEGVEEESEEADTPPKAPQVPVVMIQRAPPAVHKPVPGKTMMPLSFVHRFMTSGEIVDVPVVQR